MSSIHGSGAIKPTFSLTLNVTPEMMRGLEQLARDSKQPLESVFTRALALYREVIRVSDEGKHVGYATSSDALDVEFTGLTDLGGP